MNWSKELKGKIKVNEPLKKHTSFKIGGPARFFFEPEDITSLRKAILYSKAKNIPVFIIGSGSNLLVSDKGVNGLVIHFSSKAFTKISKNQNFVTVGCGVTLNRLVGWARKRNLAGVDFLVGIPGTLGGAVVMNAGAWGKEFASLVKEVMVMDYKGRVIKLTRNKIRFGYRYSNLSKYIVLSVTIILGKKSQKGILNNIKLNISKRIARQDLSLPSAGCIFKNPSGHSAGRLIDLCGLKGRRSGGAIISAKHANFILNYHKASASDVLALMNTVKKEVRRKFGINLCPEVKIWR